MQPLEEKLAHLTPTSPTFVQCELNKQRKLRITQKNVANSGADPEGGGGARPPVFAPNSLKSPLIWPKYA